MENAENYTLTVATRSYGESKGALVAGFDNKTLPSSEWDKSGLYDSREKYCGENTPSLKFSKQADYLITPMFDDEIQSISFWCRISREGSGRLEVIGCDSEGNLVNVAKLTDFTTTGQIVELNMPADIHRLAIYYYMGSVELSMNIDDFTLTFAGDVTFTPVDGYDNLLVDGETLSVKVEGLQKDTEYFAFVKSNNGDVDSKMSRKAMFRTLSESGVEKVDKSAEIEVLVSNGLVSVSDMSVFDIYSIDGRLIASQIRGNYQLPNKGIYIVKSSNNAVKIVW
jgi:hypothetical protein